MHPFKLIRSLLRPHRLAQPAGLIWLARVNPLLLQPLHQLRQVPLSAPLHDDFQLLLAAKTAEVPFLFFNPAEVPWKKKKKCLIQESMIPGKRLLEAVKVVEKLQDNYKKLSK